MDFAFLFEIQGLGILGLSKLCAARLHAHRLGWGLKGGSFWKFPGGDIRWWL
jgi:hypothetical protein